MTGAACACWGEPINVFIPWCHAAHCCFRNDEPCHDEEMR